MRKFIFKIILFLLPFLIYALWQPLHGLYRLQCQFPYPKKGIIKMISPRNDKNILLIGCSNLQENINQKMMKDSLPFGIDFLYFPGSHNSTFLQFVFDLGLAQKYKKIVLYAPYHLLKQTKFLDNSNGGNFRNAGGGLYVFNTIKRSPFNVLYNWNIYCDSVAVYNQATISEDFIATNDESVEIMRTTETSYKNCNHEFLHNKHIIQVPSVYTEDDVEFINSLKEKEQELFILFTPIPNIKENNDAISKTNVLSVGFENVLNKPVLLDSALFYDQWYHLNNCGSILETRKMINIMRSLVQK